MFGKKKRSVGEMATTNKVDTIVGRDTRFKGDIETSGILHIQGQLEGNIKSNSDIIITENAVVKGEVFGVNMVVTGTLLGNCVLEGRLEIGTTGKITGDIKVGALIIEEGGLLDGKCEMPTKGPGAPQKGTKTSK